MYFKLSVITFCFFVSCSKPDDRLSESLRLSLHLAGNNRVELLNALNHYISPKDILKRQAMIYLVENLPGQYHYEGPGVRKYRKSFAFFDSLNNLKQTEFRRLWVGLQDTMKVPQRESVHYVKDIKVIKAAFLINNVEKAFKAWSYPWAKNLSFEEFCEYLLPYKIQNEDMEDWRTPMQKRYAWLADSLKNNPDAKAACLLINRDLKKWFHIAPFIIYWDMTANDLVTLKGGRCKEATAMALFAMRAMGLPVVIDYTPYWANKNAGHEWNALIYKNQTLHFVGTESDPGIDKTYFTKWDLLRRKRAKVYRRTFALQPTLLEPGEGSKLPQLISDWRFIDVTNLYVPVSDISIPLSNVPRWAKFCFLQVFNGQQWKPITFSKISTPSQVDFMSVGRDVVYLPVAYRTKTVNTPLTAPFTISKTGLIKYLIPNKSNARTIILKQKYPEDKSNYVRSGENYELFYWSDKWVSMGKKRASSDSLVYTKAPLNALFWLKHLDKGSKQERIFTYESKQIWW